jgi:hypothetical protein
MPFYTTENIPYQEYRAISDLVRAHLEAQNGRLKAVIVFGALVAGRESQDINLLEIVDGWDGPRHARFGSSTSLPLRGQLNLYFLLPSEFESPDTSPLPGETFSSAELLSRVRNAYAILLEKPNDYAFSRIARLDEAPRVDDIRQPESDPIGFVRERVPRSA